MNTILNFNKPTFTVVMILLTVGSIFTTCTGQVVSSSHLISNLEQAENDMDLNQVSKIFHDTAIIYTTDLIPIKGNGAISNLFGFVFSRNDKESISYIVDSVSRNNHNVFEYGRNITLRHDGNHNTQPFTAIFNDDSKITEMYYGPMNEVITQLPEMIPPTGKYNVGISTHFYDKTDHNSRTNAFQIWYPTHSTGKAQPFRSQEVIGAVADFLGLPVFIINYFSQIDSYSIPKAKPVSDTSFPVLIYNHGYGGFTQVYQTIFEDLVSHGYIIVSIGHEDESALIIKESGDIIQNSPENDFFRARGPELVGEEIGRWQSQVLFSDDTNDNRKAYEEMLKLTPLHNESTRLWAYDTKITIEKLRTLNEKDNLFKGIFDLNKIGIFGHSLGGATAGQMCFGNTELKAGINLDGFQFGDLFHSKLEVPFMFVSSNSEGNRYLRAHTFENNSKSDCIQVSVTGFHHDNFTDLKFITEGDEDAMNLQRELILSFFNTYLKGNKFDRNQLSKEYDRIVFRTLE